MKKLTLREKQLIFNMHNMTIKREMESKITELGVYNE